MMNLMPAASIEGTTTDNWSIQEVNSELQFSYQNKPKAILDSTGILTLDKTLVSNGISTFELIIASNQTNFDLRSAAVAAGWPGTTQLAVTIAPGVYISSNNTSIPALTVSGSFPKGVSLTNNGLIIGMGGAGGAGSNGAGGAGGVGLKALSSLLLNNAGTIAGGGGGGGAGANGNGGQGGGGGGGPTGLTNSAGGARAGGAGTVNGAGAGGPSIYYTNRVMTFAGDIYNPPRYRTDVYTAGGGAAGGNWGANGVGAGGAGGAGGAAVVGTALINWQTLGTRNGGVI